MDLGRREFSAGFAAAALASLGIYASTRESTPLPDECAPERLPGREGAPGCSREAAPSSLAASDFQPACVTSVLGRPLGSSVVWYCDPAGALSGPERARPEHAVFAFDRRTPFARVREHLLAQEDDEPWIEIELRSDDAGPQARRLTLRVDREPRPGVYEDDRRARERLPDRLNTPRYPTMVVLSKDATIIEGGPSPASLAPLRAAEARGSSFDATMWQLSNRANVGRIYARTPWLLVAEDCPWSQVVTALEALAPVRCQSHTPAGRPCPSAEVTLFIGAAVTPGAAHPR